MTAQEKIASLEHQLNEALEKLKGVTDLLPETQEQLQQAQARLAELEKQKTPPALVKAKKKKPKEQESKPRKKREAHYKHARRRSVPTQIGEHRIVSCPDCHRRLAGISFARSREIIDGAPLQQWKSASIGFPKGGVRTVNTAMKPRWTSPSRCWDRDALACDWPV